MSPEQEKQIVDGVLQSLKKPTPTLADRTWFKMLNSPLVIALVSGVALTIFVNKWQLRAAKLQREEARRIELRDRKEKILTEFRDAMYETLSSMRDLKFAHVWLIAEGQKAPTARGKFRGKSFEETQLLVEKFEDEFLKGRTPDALCGQVFVSFKSQPVRDASKLLGRKSNVLLRSRDGLEVDAVYNELGTLFNDLMRKMSWEIAIDDLPAGAALPPLPIFDADEQSVH